MDLILWKENERRIIQASIGCPEGTFVLCRVDIVQADHAPEAGVAQGIFHLTSVIVADGGKVDTWKENERRIIQASIGCPEGTFVLIVFTA